MIKKLSFIENLTYLSIALYALGLTYAITSTALSNQIFTLKLYSLCEPSGCYNCDSKKMSLYDFLDKANIIQFLIKIICEKKLQNISLILLLESYKLYPTYSRYLQKYKIVFRKFFEKNFIGHCHYYDDTYIAVLALINLRLILICSNINGVYILWLYLTCFSFRKYNQHLE